MDRHLTVMPLWCCFSNIVKCHKYLNIQISNILSASASYRGKRVWRLLIGRNFIELSHSGWRRDTGRLPELIPFSLFTFAGVSAQAQVQLQTGSWWNVFQQEIQFALTSWLLAPLQFRLQACWRQLRALTPTVLEMFFDEFLSTMHVNGDCKIATGDIFVLLFCAALDFLYSSIVLLTIMEDSWRTVMVGLGC